MGVQQINQLLVQSAALLCPDGQIHEAVSRMRCHTCPDGRCRGNVTASCYQAAPQDPEARFVWYTGNNQDDEKDGEAYYGYRSLPLQLVDQEHRFSITLLDDVRSANQR